MRMNWFAAPVALAVVCFLEIPCLILARAQDGPTQILNSAQPNTTSRDANTYAGLSDKELFDKATDESNSGREDAAFAMLKSLLDRYPFLQDKKQVRKLPKQTQKLLEQASTKLLMIGESRSYFARTGVRLGRIGHGVSAPQLIHQGEPELTAEAREQRSVDETVVVNLIVNVQGLPESVHVIRSAPMGLDAQALKAVTEYRFKPAMENGTPVAVMLNVEVRFQKF
jgi:TonB family protein